MGVAKRLPFLLAILLAASTVFQPAAARGGRSLLTTSLKTHHLFWTVELTNVTRACKTVTIPTLNGQYPGPTIHINEGDHLVINVTNKMHDDVSIHWHGIKQRLTNWVDGPAHITQCPLAFGDSFIYEFTVTAQSGTFFWHAHVNWLRATVYGAFIVHPKAEPPYPKPKAKIPILFGEWFAQAPNTVEDEGLAGHTLVFNASIANTLDGQPGPLYSCSTGATVVKVHQGKTYLFQLVNAALNSNLFFVIANHTMKVVAVDGNYIKQFSTSVIMLQPGQTADVLMKADQPKGEYYFGVREWRPLNMPGPSIASVGIIKYQGRKALSDTPTMPTFPDFTDNATALGFNDRLRNLNTYSLPDKMDHEFFFVAGVANVTCKAAENCTSTNGRKVAATINNVTFVPPFSTSILQAYYNHQSNGVYTTNFPEQPPLVTDFVDYSPAYSIGTTGTEVITLKFNQTVQIVIQNVDVLGKDDHPFHLHGHDFYVIGSGIGNYNESVDAAKFNLVDPPSRNTVGSPEGGWVAIRFQANNPGVWLLHCHLEQHLSWGMMMVFITENGEGPNNTLPGPTHTPPKCYNSLSYP